MKADEKTEAEVASSISRFLETYASRDIEGTLALLAPDQDIIIVGTGVDEKIIGKENARRQIERDYGQAGDISIRMGPLAISAAGPVAWVYSDSIWEVKFGDQSRIYKWRWTLVLENRQGKWLIVHSHLSAPAQPEGLSFPSKC